jgi:hypothetical protein
MGILNPARDLINLNRRRETEEVTRDVIYGDFSI